MHRNLVVGLFSLLSQYPWVYPHSPHLFIHHGAQVLFLGFNIFSPLFLLFTPIFFMEAIFMAEAVLSKMQWLWLILSQPYYLAARWSAVLKWIMNPWNWLSVTFIILMERQVRSGLTTSHANESTTAMPALLKAFICLKRRDRNKTEMLYWK